MARLPRLTLPGIPHHVIQRGNNRQPIFVDAQDHLTMLGLLAEHAQQESVAVHAYVLMPNHMHLLVTPEKAQSLPRFMQAVGRRYVRLFNDRHQRSGTLWDGRYRAAVLEPEAYLLASMVCIELNPVRADLVADATLYQWSSLNHHLGLRADRLITPHPLFWALGNTPFAREHAYTALVREGLSAQLSAQLTQSAEQGWALGSDAFVADLQSQTVRRLTRARPGRPPRQIKVEAIT